MSNLGICHILQEVKHSNCEVSILFKDDIKHCKIQIARFIADTPGVAEVCNVKNHRSGMLKQLNAPILTGIQIVHAECVK